MGRIRRTSVGLVAQLQEMVDSLYELSTQMETDVKADRIRSGSIAGREIILDDDGAGASIIRSSNYNGGWDVNGLDFDGDQGWAIHSSGDGEFAGNVVVEGDFFGNWDGNIPVDLSVGADPTASKGYAGDSSEGSWQLMGDVWVGGNIVLLG